MKHYSQPEKDEFVKAISADIASGMSQEKACAKNGIAVGSYQAWKNGGWSKSPKKRKSLPVAIEPRPVNQPHTLIPTAEDEEEGLVLVGKPNFVVNTLRRMYGPR